MIPLPVRPQAQSPQRESSVSAVYVLPLGDLAADILDAIDDGIQQVFGLEVRRLNAEQTPGYAYDTTRAQYSSELILRALIKHCPAEALRLLAITDVDLFIPMLTFVYGQAQLNGRVSVVSTARMHQEFYSLIRNRPLMLNRVRKEAVHELAHTFGLTHCPLPLCPMSIATGIDQLDGKGDALCAGCVHLLRDALAGIVRTHYE